MSDITVFTARRIHTMNPGLPAASAVAVQEGRILEVGTVDSIAPWLEGRTWHLDDRFRDKVLMPGFIDPHLHPTNAAVFLQTHFITAMDWKLPWSKSPAVQGHENYLQAVRQLNQSLGDQARPLLTRGYHRIWHGEMSRTILDGISATRPIIVIQRSGHELFINTAAMKWLQVDEAEVARHPQADLAEGRFYEMGKSLVLRTLNKYLFAPERIAAGYERVKQVVLQGGHTTVAHMGVGLLNDVDTEWSTMHEAFERDDNPFRIAMIPTIRGDADAQKELDRFSLLPERNSRRLFCSDHVKFFSDGGFFAEYMQMLPPGFIDGHAGEWMTAPEKLEEYCRAAWMRGLRIHVHCTGDMGVELTLDILQRLQAERPRFDHRFTIEHFGISTPEQCERIGALGAQVSANPYYLYELAEAYWKSSIGMERASQMVRLGSLSRAGVRFALHSDHVIAPALPLNNAWIAANRMSESGNVMAPGECVSVHLALRAITIDAAYMLGMENDVGSIRSGKRADFTILAEDPYEVPPLRLKDIAVEGVVFEGSHHPCRN